MANVELLIEVESKGDASLLDGLLGGPWLASHNLRTSPSPDTSLDHNRLTACIAQTVAEEPAFECTCDPARG